MRKKVDRKPIQEGAIFTKKYKNIEYKMTTIVNDGILKFKVNDKVFDSPTAAAKFVKGDKIAVNGWVFWKMNK